MPEPATEVLHRARDEHLARSRDAVTRAPMWTPCRRPRRRELALAGVKAATESRPKPATASTIASAQRIARAGPVERGEDAVACGVDLAPLEPTSWLRTAAWCRSRRSRQPPSPSAGSSVEPTMSVNSTVVSPVRLGRAAPGQELLDLDEDGVGVAGVEEVVVAG